MGAVHREMQSQAPPLLSAEHSRVNVRELKAQIAKRLGPDRAPHYFNCLNELLLQKLSKSEFNKLCSQILGKDNLPLHNQLIRSILHNACQSKAPPPVVHGKDSPRLTGIAKKNSFQMDVRFTSSEASRPPIQTFANGHIMPLSPRKSRGGIQIKDQLSNLGPNGRTESHYGEAVLWENGDSSLYDLKRSVQHHQGIVTEQSIKKLKLEKESLAEAVIVRNREDQEHHIDSTNSRGPLQAPLGIPFFSASIGGSQRCPFPTAGTGSSYFFGNYDASELCETEVLKKRMEKIAEAQGLEGVTMDCANLLNNGLDAYLKRLIASCVELVGSRTTHEPIKPPLSKLQSHAKPINGVWVGHRMQTQNIDVVSAGNDEPRKYSVTMQDLLVAMELKPQQLGEDWPLLLEKICLCSFEE